MSSLDPARPGVPAPWKATRVAPADLVPGRALVVAPHPDDEVLGCGALIASLVGADPAAVTVAVATDGALSPRLPGLAPAAGLAKVRSGESAEALARLGLPVAALTFFNLPDRGLGASGPRLEQALINAVRGSDATALFVPFRYDGHPDHMALHMAGVRVAAACPQLEMFEYFVYPRWQLLRQGDVRYYLAPGELLALESDTGAAAAKRAALDAYRSQTTRWLEGQQRPILDPALLDRICAEPETFLRHDPRRPGPAVFSGSAVWFRVVLRIEPRLKRWKDHLCERMGWSR